MSLFQTSAAVKFWQNGAKGVVGGLMATVDN